MGWSKLWSDSTVVTTVQRRRLVRYADEAQSKLPEKVQRQWRIQITAGIIKPRTIESIPQATTHNEKIEVPPMSDTPNGSFPRRKIESPTATEIP